MSIPTGIRASEPSTTGTAVSSSVRVALNDFAKGETRLHAAKQAMNASVASASCLDGRRPSVCPYPRGAAPHLHPGDR